MMNQNMEITDESLGREIFGPLGGIVELGAVAEAGPERPLGSVSVTDFVARHREVLDRVTLEIQKIGNFDSTIMTRLLPGESPTR